MCSLRGGKRLRAVLTLLACEAAGGKTAVALPAAVAIELLHNFTLIHDDIMDKADLRRGRPTVHKRWSGDIAILSGDQLAAVAYCELLRTKCHRLPEMTRVFTGAFNTVCEGQAYDMEFEQRGDVRAADYLMMIDKKTAAVISAAAELGALAADAPAPAVRALRAFGMFVGRAFQLRDDILDIEGSEQEIGKRVGNDILEGKRTFLLLAAAERARGSDRMLVEAILRRDGVGPAAIPAMREVYRSTGALDEAAAMIGRETLNAQRALRRLEPGIAASVLGWLAGSLRGRSA